MASIQNNTSNSSYSYISAKYWCYPCNRQFSQLCAEGTTPSPSPCPRCNLPADPLPTSNPTRNNTLNTRTTTAPRASSTPNTPQSQPQGGSSADAPEFLFFTQQMMDPSGRVFYRTYRIPVDETLLEELSRNDPSKCGPAPASEEVIKSLQEVKFEQDLAAGEGAESACCAVCMEDYKQGESLVRLPCKHEFHKACVSTWLGQHNSCPMCRQGI